MTTGKLAAAPVDVRDYTTLVCQRWGSLTVLARAEFAIDAAVDPGEVALDGV